MNKFVLDFIILDLFKEIPEKRVSFESETSSAGIPTPRSSTESQDTLASLDSNLPIKLRFYKLIY